MESEWESELELERESGLELELKKMILSNRDKKHIQKLVPEIRDKAEKYLKRGTAFTQNCDKDLCNSFDWRSATMRITDSLRDPILQAGLYSQGRRWIKEFRIWELSPADGDPVTWTMNSKHLWGKAFDATPFIGSKPYWPDTKIESNKIVWMELHKIAYDLGLKTIGLKDAVHIEI